MAASRSSMRKKMQEEKDKKEKEEPEQQTKKKKRSFRNSFKRDKNKPTKTKELIEKAVAKSKGVDVNASPEKPKKSLADILAELKKEKEKTTEGKEEQEAEKEPIMVKNAGRYSPHGKESDIRSSLKSVVNSPAPVQHSRNNSSTRSSNNKSPITSNQRQNNNVDHHGRTPSPNKNVIYQGDQVIPQKESSSRVQRNESRKSQMSRYSGNSNNSSHYYDNDVRDADPRNRYDSFVDEDDDFVPPERNKPKNQCK